MVQAAICGLYFDEILGAPTTEELLLGLYEKALPALKAALEDLREPYRGVVSTYDKPFSKDDHDAFSDRMIWLGEWRNGSIVYHHAGDAKMSAQMRRKTDS